MNPLAPYKFVGRLLMALVALTSMFWMTACGSGSSITPPNNEGFSDGSLTGTYVISMSGTDVNTASDEEFTFAIVGTITADGKGGITGTVDINDPGVTGVNMGQAVSSSSSYSVKQDGRGTGKLVTPKGSFNVDFALSSTNHGLITRFDDVGTSVGTGSGTIDMQSTATQGSLSALAFSLSGVDSGGNPLVMVGGVALNTTTGAITSGTQDFNDSGSSAESGFNGLPVTGGSVFLSSGTSGTASFTNSSASFGSLSFDVWVIDSTHLKIIENDDTLNVLSGDAFTQQTSFPAGQLVFALGGFDSSFDPLATGGFVTTDANGTLSNGTEDYNDAGSANTVTGFGGSCNATAPFAGGRCELALSGFSNGALGSFVFAAYPYSSDGSSGVLMLEIDNFGLMQGSAYAQTATSFTAPAGFGLNLSGENTDGQGDVGEVDNIAQFNATTTAPPAINLTGSLDENSILGGLDPGVSLSGTYTPDSTPDGRGSITIPSISTFIGTLNLEYYVANSSTVLFIDVDQDQVAVGTFEAQSTPGAGAAMHAHPAIVHPAVRPRAAKQSKWAPAGSRK
jgi:hypothetical protein